MAVGLLKLWDARDGHGGGFGGFVFVAIGAVAAAGDHRRHPISFARHVAAAARVPRRLSGLAGPRRAAPAGGGRRALDRVSALAILSGVNRGNNSRAFRGGDLTAVMGGCEIDLRAGGDQRRGGDRRVRVLGRDRDQRARGLDASSPGVTPLMGGVEDKTRPPLGAAAHRLVVRGVVVMGGVEVKN